jgi:Ca-activated chloride channel homolog
MNRSQLAIILAVASFLFLGYITGGTAKAQNTERDRMATPTPPATPSPTRTIEEETEVGFIETELVNLNVRVVDRNNRPINGLKQSDFTIFEDNVKQEIDFFSQSEVPTNYALVIDNSGSLRSQIQEVIDAGKILVGTNRPEDETSVIRFVSSDKIEIVQDFTANAADLNDALDNLYIEGGRTAIIDAVYLAVQRVSDFEKNKDRDDRTRRALILVSDGEDVNSFYSQKQLFDLIKESDVQIYAVGFIKDLESKGGFVSKSAQSKARSFLETLATQTGGKAYFPNAVSELNTLAREIASEMRTQYSIGYIPSNDREDGTYRNIKVSIADGPRGEKRIPVTRAGRTASTGGKGPALQRPGQ